LKNVPKKKLAWIFQLPALLWNAAPDGNREKPSGYLKITAAFEDLYNMQLELITLNLSHYYNSFQNTLDLSAFHLLQKLNLNNGSKPCKLESIENILICASFVK
jgi:hypothetical protein